jgi:uncharacterized protein
MLQKIRAIAQAAAAADSAHDFSHSQRVLINALRIAEQEGGDREVLAAAAYLHDIANLPKNHPESRLSSERSAERAGTILSELGFAEHKIPIVQDAILCHSYSRGLTPTTPEGRIFQDADRLDALGAIGIARTFAVGGATQRPMLAEQDPFLKAGRLPDDKDNTLDHFWVKLFKLEAKMLTPTGRRLAGERVARMRRFVDELEDEVSDSRLALGLTPGLNPASTNDGKPGARA